MTDPYAPPTQQPPWGQYPPYGYGYGPPPGPPPRKNRTLVVVLVSIGVALFVLLPVVVFVAGGIVRTVSSSTSRQTTVVSPSYRVSEDSRGPAFRVDILPGWTPLSAEAGSDARIRLRSADGAFVEIHSSLITGVEPLDAALRDAVRDNQGFGSAPTGVPRSRTVAGSDALMQRITSEDSAVGMWVAVFHFQSARFVVTYLGDASTATEPFELRMFLDSFSW